MLDTGIRLSHDTSRVITRFFQPGAENVGPGRSRAAAVVERVRALSEEEVVKKMMLSQTVDGEFTTAEDVAKVASLFAGFETNALTGQSLVVSHGWFME